MDNDKKYDNDGTYFMIIGVIISFTIIILWSMGMWSYCSKGKDIDNHCQARLEVYSIYRDDGEQMSAKEICEILQDLK